jgi:hypothetical protein
MRCGKMVTRNLSCGLHITQSMRQGNSRQVDLAFRQQERCMWKEREAQDCRACVATIGLSNCTKKDAD